MTDSTHPRPALSTPDGKVVERLVPLWLEEAEHHDEDAAREARAGWERGELSAERAHELADWVTARVTDTGFNEDEGPAPRGPAPISVADKAAVHRWLAAQGHDVR